MAVDRVLLEVIARRESEQLRELMSKPARLMESEGSTETACKTCIVCGCSMRPYSYGVRHARCEPRNKCLGCGRRVRNRVKCRRCAHGDGDATSNP